MAKLLTFGKKGIGTNLRNMGKYICERCDEVINHPLRDTARCPTCGRHMKFLEALYANYPYRK